MPKQPAAGSSAGPEHSRLVNWPSMDEQQSKYSGVEGTPTKGAHTRTCTRLARIAATSLFGRIHRSMFHHGDETNTSDKLPDFLGDNADKKTKECLCKLALSARIARMSDSRSIRLQPPPDRSFGSRFARRLLVHFLRLTMKCVSLSPLILIQSYGFLIGRFIDWTNLSVKRICERNLRIAFPEQNPKERNALLRRSLNELGRTILETTALWTWNEKKIKNCIAEVHGKAAVDQAFQAGNGVLILAPHLGAWEMLGLHLSFEYKVTSLYRPPRLDNIEVETRAFRERFGAKLVPTTLVGVTALIRALGRNEMAAVLPDQDPGKSGGIHAPFFGQPANTMQLASRLAARTGCKIFFAYAERLRRGRGYDIHYIPASETIGSSDPLQAAIALNQGIQECILRKPSQYLWSYKRYKNPPSGEACPYSHRRAA